MDSSVKATPKKPSKESMGIVEDLIASGATTIDPFAQSLNIEVVSANAEQAEGLMRVTPHVLNPYGSVHGGCLVALADSVAGHNMAAAGKLSVTLNSTVNFLSPAVGKMVKCRSKIQKMGRKISVVSVEATDEKEKLLFTAMFTFSAVKEIEPHIIVPQEH